MRKAQYGALGPIGFVDFLIDYQAITGDRTHELFSGYSQNRGAYMTYAQICREAASRLDGSMHWEFVPSPGVSGHLRSLADLLGQLWTPPLFDEEDGYCDADILRQVTSPLPETPS